MGLKNMLRSLAGKKKKQPRSPEEKAAFQKATAPRDARDHSRAEIEKSKGRRGSKRVRQTTTGRKAQNPGIEGGDSPKPTKKRAEFPREKKARRKRVRAARRMTRLRAA